MTREQYNEQIDALFNKARTAIGKGRLRAFQLAMLDLCELALAHEEFWQYQAHPRFVRNAFKKLQIETEKLLGTR